MIRQICADRFKQNIFELDINYVLLMLNTMARLTNLENYDVQDMFLLKQMKHQVKNSKVTYQRIKISTKYNEQNNGPLIIKAPSLFSFGL